MDMIAISGIAAQDLIIELRSFIIQRSTRSNFARAIQIKLNLVTMEICALSHILKRRSLLISYISSTNLKKKMIIQLTSLCFISRRFGVPIAMPRMQEMLVFTHITGRTLGGSLMFSTMRESSALSGRRNILFRHMQMDAGMSIDADSLTGGRSKSIIHSTTRCMLAGRERPVQNRIVPTFIRRVETADIH